MTIDSESSNRYLTVDNGGSVHQGWQTGWDIFNAAGSPTVKLSPIKHQIERGAEKFFDVGSFDLQGIWPDTEHYDQNSPGIMKIASDIDRRLYESRMDKAFWLNVTRVPICVSYLAACAKVYPRTILELGTGGDSAHSTGIFSFWLNKIGGRNLVSVDRHPLCHTWLRYRHNPFWKFIQGDSLTVMQAIIGGKIDCPKSFDMIFIDSSHEYEHTLAELNQASMMTDAMLMDDSTHPGVKQAIEEWLPKNPEWLRVDMHSAVSFLERHPYIS